MLGFEQCMRRPSKMRLKRRALAELSDKACFFLRLPFLCYFPSPISTVRSSWEHPYLRLANSQLMRSAWRPPPHHSTHSSSGDVDCATARASSWILSLQTRQPCWWFDGDHQMIYSPVRHTQCSFSSFLKSVSKKVRITNHLLRHT